MFEPRPEQNSSGFRLAAHTSSWRVTAWYPGPGGNGEPSRNRSGYLGSPGVFRRMRKASERSFRGPVQNSIVEMSGSPAGG